VLRDPQSKPLSGVAVAELGLLHGEFDVDEAMSLVLCRVLTLQDDEFEP